jgi:hypothetical protein
MSQASNALQAIIDIADIILKDRLPEYLPCESLLLGKVTRVKERRRKQIDAWCELLVKRRAFITAAPASHDGFFRALVERRDQADYDLWYGDE